eukprot:5654466-Alexandrium_andersonii.AAC.1
MAMAKLLGPLMNGCKACACLAKRGPLHPCRPYPCIARMRWRWLSSSGLGSLQSCAASSHVQTQTET